jgi:GUN4-like/TIR domain
VSEEAIKIFYSYSRKDLDMRNTLEDHLSALREANRISTWHDLELEAGTEWKPAILNKLDTADIILLLVSRNFIASKYCYGTELKRAIARHNEGTTRVIPIILRPCDWNHSDVPFSKLNVLPTHAEPIASWVDQDAAFTIVAQRIRKIVDQLTTQKRVEEQEKQRLLAQKEAEEKAGQDFSDRKSISLEEKNINSTMIKIDWLSIPRRELQECDSAKIRFIKNVKDPERWAYSLDRMEQPASKAFELMWRTGSHGANLPKVGDLMILHQRAKVTHVVEFLDKPIRQPDSGFFRWVRAVWIAEQDWNQLPHQKDILGFNPNYADGNTHSFNSPNFSTFQAAWSSLDKFQKHIVQRLTQPELTVTDEDILASEKDIDYTQLRNLLKAGEWKEADEETAQQMCEVMGRQEEDWLRVEDIEHFPCTDLHTIDQLWVKYSNGKFGFSVQKQIWEECGSPMEFNADWEKFGDCVGWRKGFIVKEWVHYSEITFSISAPRGHLPRWGVGLEGNVVERALAVILSLGRRLIVSLLSRTDL